MAILIKRYANRKLYNTQTSRYITLKGIAQLLDEGEEVRVIDNESGDDITQVALSQILVDNERAREDPSDTLLTQILSRGGDALYGAIRKSVDDATDGIGEFQQRFREFVSQAEATSRGGRPFVWDRRSGSDASPGSPSDAHAAAGGDDLAKLVGEAVTHALEAHGFPRRSDLDVLSRRLEHLTRSIERLEARLARED